MTATKKIAWYFLYVLYTFLSSAVSFGLCTRMYVASTMPMQSWKSGSPIGLAIHASCSASVQPCRLSAVGGREQTAQQQGVSNERSRQTR